MLQIAIKAVNDLAKLNSLVLILLVYKIYLWLTLGFIVFITITKRRIVIRKAIKEVVRFYTKKDVEVALSIRNRPYITYLLNLTISSKVIVY